MWTKRFLAIFVLIHARVSIAAIGSDSCVSRCSHSADLINYDCQCNTLCETYQDCCVDYYELCKGADYSCNGRCGESYNSANPCHCNSQCSNYENCCGDYANYCTSNLNSCDGRCDEQYDSTNPCHCNTLCSDYNNCCSDYSNFCSGTGGGGGSGGDLSSLAQALWTNDVNRVDYVINTANANQNLFTNVDDSKLNSGTWPSFMALLDNYNRLTGSGDDRLTSAEDVEVESFLDEIFQTSVMTETTSWVIANNYFSSQAQFRTYLKDTWFTVYSRSGGAAYDSSAFEHVFVGEVKNEKVSGYHNWLAFHLDEEAGITDFMQYKGDNQPNQILMKFNLKEGSITYLKETGSIFCGASPEFEMAIFTACFLENPNAVSTFTMNGETQNVQTWDYQGSNYIGSAYFNV